MSSVVTALEDLAYPLCPCPLPIGVNHTLCLILSIELLDVLDVNTTTGLLGDRAVRIATEKNFDGITLSDRHLRGLSLFISGRKTKFLRIEGERGIDITPGGHQRAQVP